jgi:hypothetical protein
MNQTDVYFNLFQKFISGNGFEFLKKQVVSQKIFGCRIFDSYTGKLLLSNYFKRRRDD